MVCEKADSIGKANFYVEIDIWDDHGKSVADNIIRELCQIDAFTEETFHGNPGYVIPLKN